MATNLGENRKGKKKRNREIFCTAVFRDTLCEKNQVSREEHKKANGRIKMGTQKYDGVKGVRIDSLTP